MPPRPLTEASLPWPLPLACDRRSEAAWLQAWVWGTLSCLCAGGYSRAPSHPQLERWEPTCPGRSEGARVMGRVPVLSAGSSSRRIPLCRAEDTGAGRGGDGAHRPWPWGCRRGAGNGVRGSCLWPVGRVDAQLGRRSWGGRDSPLQRREDECGGGGCGRWGSARPPEGSEAGVRPPHAVGCRAGNGWRWLSSRPQRRHGGEAWCPFRRLPAHGGLQHPQVGGQPPELQQEHTQGLEGRGQ